MNFFYKNMYLQKNNLIGSEKTMLFKRIKGDPQARFYIGKCRRCGKPFIKLQNRSTLCSEECRTYNTQDSKSNYQRKRRKLIRDGELITNENDNQIGTSTVRLSKHVKPTWEEEHHTILQEKRRVGLISQ